MKFHMCVRVCVCACVCVRVRVRVRVRMRMRMRVRVHGTMGKNDVTSVAVLLQSALNVSRYM